MKKLKKKLLDESDELQSARMRRVINTSAFWQWKGTTGCFSLLLSRIYKHASTTNCPELQAKQCSSDLDRGVPWHSHLIVMRGASHGLSCREMWSKFVTDNLEADRMAVLADYLRSSTRAHTAAHSVSHVFSHAERVCGSCVAMFVGTEFSRPFWWPGSWMKPRTEANYGRARRKMGFSIEDGVGSTSPGLDCRVELVYFRTKTGTCKALGFQEIVVEKLRGALRCLG